MIDSAELLRIATECPDDDKHGHCRGCSKSIGQCVCAPRYRLRHTMRKPTVITLLAENARLSEEVARLTAERRWIPVGERMPEMGERVVVRYFYGRAIAELTSGGFHDADGAIHDVTHWVRLPEPPK